VEVWVRRRAFEWTPVYVPLPPAGQAEGFPGGRRLALPPVTVPPETPTKTTSRPARAAAGDDAGQPK
jgi:hypothetical protein